MGGQSYCKAPVKLGAASLLSSVFVYGARLSYLSPVLTPLSSCLKSVLLIFLFTHASAKLQLPLSVAPRASFSRQSAIPLFLLCCWPVRVFVGSNFHINFSVDYTLPLP